MGTRDQEKKSAYELTDPDQDPLVPQPPFLQHLDHWSGAR
jgi:hypothetical protein